MPDKANHEAHNCVQSLFDTLVDVNHGYDELIDRADASVRELIKDVADQHTADIAEIETVSKTCGMALDRSGTLMSDVHKTAVKLRDLFSELDEHVLSAVASGEENVLSAYDTAIKNLPDTHDLHETLSQQRQRLKGKIDALSQAA